MRVIEVTASQDIRTARLTSRGREDAAEIAARLARSVAIPGDIPVETVVNDGSLDDGLTRFLAALNRAAADVPG